MTEVISCARLDLVALTPELLRLTEHGDVDGLSRVLQARVDPDWPATVPAAFRRRQLANDPGQQPWLSRAMVLRGQRQVVGNIGFHSCPDDAGRVELGYEVLPGQRRRGYALESVRALTTWAVGTGLARMCVASVAPDNAASLSLVSALGFVEAGVQLDSDEGLRLVFECSLPLTDPAR